MALVFKNESFRHKSQLLLALLCRERCKKISALFQIITLIIYGTRFFFTVWKLEETFKKSTNATLYMYK